MIHNKGGDWKAMITIMIGAGRGGGGVTGDIMWGGRNQSTSKQ